MSRINYLFWGLKPEISIVFAIIFKVYGQLKFSCSAELSMIKVLLPWVQFYEQYSEVF